MNNNIYNICKEYEHWLQNDLLTEDYNIPLNESKGEMFNTFDNITKKLFKGYKKNGLYYKDTEGIYHLENNFDFSSDVKFLNKVTLRITFDKNETEQGNFIYSKSWYNFASDKLEDVEITYNEVYKNFPNISKDEFYKTIFHELQHVYRYSQKEKQEETRKLNNRTVKPKSETENYLYDKFVSDEVATFTKNLFYCINRNEINSHFSEIYPYIKNNKKINFTNYKNYLKDIPGYNIIQRLYEYQYYLSDEYTKQNPFVKEEIAQSFYNIYSNNQFYKYKRLTLDGCFNMTRKRVDNTLLYVEKKFYQFLKAALTKLKRRKI